MRTLKKILKRIFITIILIPAICFGIFAYSIYVEPNLLSVRNIEINNSSNIKNEDTIKIAQISDIHLGEYYTIDKLEKLVNKVNSQNADIIVFTGDLFDNVSKFEDTSKVAPILKKLNAKIGKYAIYGNHDYGGGAKNIYKNVMEDSGFKILVNDQANVKLDSGKTISILGLDDALLGNPDVEKTARNIKESNYNLLLLHEPDLSDKFVSYNIDLILAGHSHGGQVKIPFLGEIVTPPLAEKYKDGLYNLNTQRNTQLYVNSGIGNTKMPFRFMNVPEVSIFEIKA
ncbi:metallophosphoesterase [Clostridium botulinum]|uniref:metallophosphoesterase n=1 Tax=unclassified Clostridium TaxID=2614128 RepID=UPI00050219F3|nr:MULTISPECIES: metallophosphoesterase [unclassified Clostridium]AIY80332.1 calcineurin-like phosphoesterase family protein [Clostridium botulinum 202F]KAI3348670.1 metallophosphoesterase [Clostridium botulinum]KFX58391.1 DNA repair exonuclease [Clostridium botulinum]KFX59244.1 DNA repair exonuclease [Clostridium botulinum]KON12514.1 DNA repair exonuclease [Clostridium botulinum]